MIETRWIPEPGVSKASVHAMVRRILQPGQRAVDVGAAVGEITAVMRECVGPEGHVVAIEPRDTEIAGAPDHVFRVACGASTGRRPLYHGRIPTCASLHPGAIVAPGELTPQFVDVCRLDDLVDAAQLIKVDVQGSELHVLDGAPRLLRECPAWLLEVWPHGLLAAGSSIAELWLRLADHGLQPQSEDGVPVDRPYVAEWLMQQRKTFRHMNWLCVRTR